MPKGILGRKIGMTQIFDEEGNAIAVTAIEAGPCVVVQRKTTERDGYEAVQLAFEEIPERKANRPMKGHFQRAGVKPHRHLREIRLAAGDPMADLSVGATVRADLFQPGEYVDVTGISKGHGFAGVVKRWGFNRGPMGHGSMYHRRVGSLGSTDPGRVFKGRKLPGRMGGERRTIQGLRVVRTDPERNLLLVSGSVPGRKGSLLIIRESVKAKKQKK